MCSRQKNGFGFLLVFLQALLGLMLSFITTESMATDPGVDAVESAAAGYTWPMSCTGDLEVGDATIECSFPWTSQFIAIDATYSLGVQPYDPPGPQGVDVVCDLYRSNGAVVSSTGDLIQNGLEINLEANFSYSADMGDITVRCEFDILPTLYLSGAPLPTSFAPIGIVSSDTVGHAPPCTPAQASCTLSCPSGMEWNSSTEKELKCEVVTNEPYVTDRTGLGCRIVASDGGTLTVNDNGISIDTTPVLKMVNGHLWNKYNHEYKARLTYTGTRIGVQCSYWLDDQNCNEERLVTCQAVINKIIVAPTPPPPKPKKKVGPKKKS